MEKVLTPSVRTCEAAVPSHSDIDKSGGNRSFGKINGLRHWQEGPPSGWPWGLKWLDSL